MISGGGGGGSNEIISGFEKENKAREEDRTVLPASSETIEVHSTFFQKQWKSLSTATAALRVSPTSANPAETPPTFPYRINAWPGAR